MSSASKTLELMEFFSPQRPEIGLSELCRMAKTDKATTYRRLQSLVDSGFVEQNLMTKRYRLGPALLQLAHTREVTVPRKAVVEEPLQALANATGETSHVSVMSGKVLYSLLAVESPRHSIRVIIDIQTFPLHATSSGLCALTFGPADLLDVAKTDLTSYTSNTITTVKALNAAIKCAHATGFCKVKGAFEEDVCSLATPLFDQTGLFAGAVSVACVATRFTAELEHTIRTHLCIASREITHNWGGILPASVEDAWAYTQAQSSELEIAQ